MILIVKDFGIVNKAEVDVFLELSCFFNDPAVLEKAEEPEIKLPDPLDHRKRKKVPEKHLLLLY